MIGICVLDCTVGFAAPRPFELVVHDGLSKADVKHLDDALSAAYPQLLDKLQLDGPPSITVQIWRSEERYQDAMEVALGSRAPGSRGYVTGPRDVRLLYHRQLSAQQEAVHEFAHALSLHVQPDFGNNPRWLWEGLAQYLAGESRELSADEDGGVACPGLAQLSSPFDGGGLVYRFGFSIVDFVARTWDFDAVMALVRSNGDIEQTLGITEQVFESRWCEFVQKTPSQM